MAGSKLTYRHLSRKSSHRQALLRNLVTSLFTHESITTTWPKAKEAQRLAEKMITHTKKNTQASRNQLDKFFYRAPNDRLPTIFETLRKRYQTRPGGYTRVLRIEPVKEDQAPSAILELVDGPKDMRFALTAKTIANALEKEHEINDMTAANIYKVTRFRPKSEITLDKMVEKFQNLAQQGDHGVDEVVQKTVYPELPRSR